MFISTSLSKFIMNVFNRIIPFIKIFIRRINYKPTELLNISGILVEYVNSENGSWNVLPVDEIFYEDKRKLLKIPHHCKSDSFHLVR